MSEIKSIKSLKSLTREIPVSLDGFSKPLYFNLHLPTSGPAKIDVMKRAESISSKFSNKKNLDREDYAKIEKAYSEIADLVYTYSDLKTQEFLIDGEIYKVENSEDFLNITLGSELMDFFMRLQGDEEVTMRMQKRSGNSQK